MGNARKAKREVYLPARAMPIACGKMLWLFSALVLAAVSGCATQTTPAPPPSANVPRPALTGIASWYGPGFNGHRTSSGEIYNQDSLTAASTLFPLGTRLLVTSLVDGRSVEVTVNDHGPYVKGRAIDLSAQAARVLGMVGPGTCRVRMEVLSSPPGGPPLGQRYFVQVGSFSDPANANRVEREFAARYTDVEVQEAQGSEARYYRVRMGAFMSRQAAQERAAQISELGYPIVIVTE
jgi:rare lipoprotein A